MSRTRGRSFAPGILRPLCFNASMLSRRPRVIRTRKQGIMHATIKPFERGGIWRSGVPVPRVVKLQMRYDHVFPIHSMYEHFVRQEWASYEMNRRKQQLHR
ncbi:hypothetical protein MRX96_049050 [Rhipicephalus microplus]